jgi:hypothetical protein
MLVRVLLAFAGPDVGVPAVGSEVEYPDHLAADLLQAGFVEPVEPEAPKPARGRKANP